MAVFEISVENLHYFFNFVSNFEIWKKNNVKFKQNEKHG